MVSMDVFNQDAFSVRSLTAAVDKVGFTPQYLATIPGLFVPPPLGQPREAAIWIETRENGPALIQTSPRGAPPKEKSGDNRQARPFVTSRLAEKSRITAATLDGIRAFGSESEVQQVQTEVARRQALIKNDFELTKENMRLGAVQGKMIDADGSVIYDWATAFGQSIPGEFDFTLGQADDGSIRTQCSAVVRSVTRGLKGLGGANVGIRSIASDSFWDELTSAKETRETFKFQEGQQLRNGVAWVEFNYGGITFANYRGTDDGSTVAVPADKAIFFPVGAGIFQEAYAPGERFELLGQPGEPAYSYMVLDKDRNSWADVEMYSYPLLVCVQPQALATGGLA
jgi:hypothetical protein